ncbi:MAG TPA: heparinase [Gammaproteobacteria bacterium]|nr:heparinase [Gammaproteobacteria bacterium]
MKPGLLTWFHTVRYLRPVQIYGRVWFRLYRPSADLSPAAPVRPIHGSWVAVEHRQQSLLRPWVFRFLNEEHSLDSQNDWDRQNIGKLWRYNLHYFDDLNAEGTATRTDWHRNLIQRWVSENPPGQGTGWEPYPTSLRIVNWIKWALRGNSLEPEWLHSLTAQVRWLTKRLESHLLGNHLFANAKALVSAGFYFKGHEAADWLERGLSILAREFPEQILSDGGHFERSPMYHALATEDVLDLINLANTYQLVLPDRWRGFVDTWKESACRMQRWLEAMSHPDGEISFFNDAAIGIAMKPARLKRYLLNLTGNDAAKEANSERPTNGQLQMLHLQESGYVRVNDAVSTLLIDAAPVGPDYLPGHAHADTLSFELSVFGQRVIVNGGTSRYGLGEEREAERGTPAHSTVTIDGQNSSEVWAGFRVARRAKPQDLSILREHDGVRISCAHDGYCRLPGRPVHRRTWASRPGSLSVEDSIEGHYTSAVARFHLHPEVICEMSEEDGVGYLKFPAGNSIRWQAKGGKAKIEASQYCPEFGRCLPTQCISVMMNGETKMHFELFW